MSGQTIPFTRQYNSFRVTSNGLNGTSNSCRSSFNSRKLATTEESASPAVTPRLCRKLATTVAKSSPLQSPQIIRSARVDTGWVKRPPQHLKTTCSMHSKSPGSSGTSVESIVPKYNNSGSSQQAALLNRTNLAATTTPQKRAYNINNGKTKVINTRIKHSINVHNGGAHLANQHNNTSSNNNINNSNNSSSSQKLIFTSVKKPSSLNSSCKENYTAYSSKFPNGLPFEDEFYHRRRKSLSETSSTASSSDLSENLPFADEFSRKPSNEALYVDFTKPLEKPPVSAVAPPPPNPLSEYNRLMKVEVTSTKKTTNAIGGSGISGRMNGNSNCEKKIFTTSVDCLENNNKKTKSVAYVSAAATAAWVPSANKKVVVEDEIVGSDGSDDDDLEPTDDNVYVFFFLNFCP